ncbi:MAG: MFS transporter [Pseudomonadota bacterium]
MSTQSSALRDRNFALYFFGAGCSLHGTWIQRIAQGWMAWELTESETWVGLVAFFDFFPVAILAPVFGVVADRVNRKNMMALANGLMMLNVACLTVVTLLGLVDIALLLVFVFIQGVLNALNTPARLTLVPNLVDKSKLSNALALMSLMFNVSRFIGPAIAGVIIATLGVAGAFAINTLSFVIFALALWRIKVGDKRARKTQAKRPLRDFADGFSYATGRPSILWSYFIIIIVGFFGRGAMELMPAFADVFYARGSGGLAALTSAAGAGAIVGALILARGKPPAELFGWVVGGGITVGISLLVFASNNNFYAGLGLMSVMGLSATIVGVGAQIIIQARVDDDYRGRVMSLWASLAFGAVAVGGLGLGLLSESLSLKYATLLAGGACAVGAILIARPFLNRARVIDEESEANQPLP